MNFTVREKHELKLERSEKLERHQDLVRVREHDVDCNTNIWKNLGAVRKESGRTGYIERDIPNYIAFVIG